MGRRLAKLCFAQVLQVVNDAGGLLRLLLVAAVQRVQASNRNIPNLDEDFLPQHDSRKTMRKIGSLVPTCSIGGGLVV